MTHYCGCEQLYISILHFVFEVCGVLFILFIGLKLSGGWSYFLRYMGYNTMKGCNKVLYENDEGEVHCGSYMSGGIMLCLECQGKTTQTHGRSL